MSSKKEVSIVHFNDVYEFGSRAKEPVGGVARFATAIKSFAAFKPIVLFSGDVFNPSVLSTTTKGKHMIPMLHELKVQCSVAGNHEFDYGPSVLAKNIADCKFPWLLSNVISLGSDEPIVGTVRKHIIEWNGIKLGLMGLAESEWVFTTNKMDTFSRYLDFVAEGTKIAKELRDSGVDMVICLAHMRMNNCDILASEVSGIDLILAGHDHFYEVHQSPGKCVVLSGVDFRNLSLIHATKQAADEKWSFDVKKVDIDSSFAEDPAMAAICKECVGAADKKMAKVIGVAGCVLDAKNGHVRSSETNLGNLLCDIMKSELESDVALMNGGSIRSDDTYGPGDFTLKMLISILPYVTVVVKIRITGEKLKEALEAGVAQFPSEAGCFPQVSGIEFAFTPEKPKGSRVEWVKVNGKPLDPAHKYTVAAPQFVAEGNDGYDCLKGSETLCDAENGVILSTLVRRYFMQMNIVSMLAGGTLTLSTVLAKWSKKKVVYTVEPKVEGRIVNLSAKK